MLAVALARHDAPEARYCNRSVTAPAIHNPNGDPGLPDCKAPEAWRSLHEVFAKSLNLPLLWRARDLSEKELREIATVAGLRLDEQVPASTALVLGYASAAPADLATLMQALVRGTTGAGAAAERPFLVDSYRLLDHEGRLVEHKLAPAAGPDLARPFADRRAAELVRAALGAPLTPGGTLAALGQHRTDAHLAKTGTTTVAAGIRDKWIVGAFAAPDGVHGYALLVGTPDPRRPLGRRITGDDLAPLAALLLKPGAPSTS